MLSYPFLALHLADLQDAGTFLGLLTFIYTKKFGNHGNSLDCSFSIFPSQWVNQPQQENNIKYPTSVHFFVKEVTHFYFYLVVILENPIECVMQFIVSHPFSEREKRPNFRDINGPAKAWAEMVSILFIWSNRAIWYDFTYWHPAFLSVPWQVNKQQTAG